MLASVTRCDVIVRCLWKNCGKAGEKNVALWLEGLRLLRKLPREAKEAEISRNLYQLRLPLALWDRGHRVPRQVGTQGNKPTNTSQTA